MTWFVWVIALIIGAVGMAYPTLTSTFRPLGSEVLSSLILIAIGYTIVYPVYKLGRLIVGRRKHG